ncbi:MAG TPA: hypothetical protein VKA96_05645 [Solirubrobacteraceae bacterium]|nr:hypothetical protein [Solirubrobacteraceae bacterium]
MIAARKELAGRAAWLVGTLAAGALAWGCGGKDPPSAEEEAYVAAAFPVVMKYCEPPGRQQAQARLAAGVVDRIGRLNRRRDVDAPFALFAGQPSSLRQASEQLAETLDRGGCDTRLARRLRRSLRGT